LGAIPSDLGWDLPGSYAVGRRMPHARVMRAARVSGAALAENGGKDRRREHGSAVGLIFEHRWLVLSQVTWVAALPDHVPRRLPGVDSVAEVPAVNAPCTRARWD